MKINQVILCVLLCGTIAIQGKIYLDGLDRDRVQVRESRKYELIQYYYYKYVSGEVITLNLSSDSGTGIWIWKYGAKDDRDEHHVTTTRRFNLNASYNDSSIVCAFETYICIPTGPCRLHITGLIYIYLYLSNPREGLLRLRGLDSKKLHSVKNFTHQLHYYIYEKDENFQITCESTYTYGTWKYWKYHTENTEPENSSAISTMAQLNPSTCNHTATCVLEMVIDEQKFILESNRVIFYEKQHPGQLYFEGLDTTRLELKISGTDSYDGYKYYDYEYYDYNYYNDKRVNLSCNSDSLHIGAMLLILDWDKETHPVYRVHVKNIQTTIDLKAIKNGKSIVCAYGIYPYDDVNDFYLIRFINIFLHNNNPREGLLRLQGLDLQHLRLKKKNFTHQFYDYYYYDGETVATSCQSDINGRWHWEYTLVKFNTGQRMFEKPITVYGKKTTKTNTITATENGTLLFCVYEKSIYGTYYELGYINVVFILRHVINITGIRQNGNIEKCGTTKNCITYTYTKNEVISLTCKFTMPEPEKSNFEHIWTLLDETFIITDNNESRNFTLLPKYNGKDLTCTANEKTLDKKRYKHRQQYSSIVRLHLSDQPQTATAKNNLYTDDDDKTIADSTSEEGPLNFVLDIKYIVLYSAAFIFLLSIIALIKFFCKRRRKANPLIVECNSSNPDNASGQPFPNVNLQRSDDDTDTDAYSTLYNEVLMPQGNVKEEPSYTVPYVPNLDDLYSKPVPKTLRGKAVNQQLYTQVLPKATRNAKQKQNNEYDYIEQQRKERCKNMAEEVPENEGYYNIFDNQPYTNSNSSKKKTDGDYAEPSYAQINI